MPSAASILIKDILNNQVSFLLFRPIRLNLQKNFIPYLVFVVGSSWLVGIGRYWDHPSAEWWQYFGLGSVAYIFALSSVLFFVVLPLRPQNWRYKNVLIFVGMTALPGLLYAIPVEKFMGLNAAQNTNAWFLAFVAIWRVALYIKYLVSVAKLSWFIVIVATILPLSAIVFALAALNLEHVVFNIMAGIKEEDATPYDSAYTVVIFLTYFAYVAFPITGIGYVSAILYSRYGQHESST